MTDDDYAKADKETYMMRHQQVKNRHFSLNTTDSPYHEILYQYQSSRYAVFTDMIENSMLDFLVVSEATV